MSKQRWLRVHRRVTRRCTRRKRCWPLGCALCRPVFSWCCLFLSQGYYGVIYIMLHLMGTSTQLEVAENSQLWICSRINPGLAIGVAVCVSNRSYYFYFSKKRITLHNVARLFVKVIANVVLRLYSSEEKYTIYNYVLLLLILLESCFDWGIKHLFVML